MSQQITIQIVGDSSKFTTATKEVADKASGLGSVISGIGLGVGAAGFGLVTDAVQDFVGSLGDADTAYKDNQAAVTILGTALKNNVPGWNGSTKAVTDYAAAQSDLGFKNDDVISSISQLVGVTHDQTTAMQLNSLAEDLARSKGIDLATATDIVTKAHEGNGRALKALGIDVTGVTGAAGLLDAIQQNVAGSASAWADTSDGKVAVSQAKQEESWQKIGSVVDRITQAVLPLATTALEIVADAISSVADVVGPVADQLSTALGPAFTTISNFLSTTVIPVISSIGKVVFPALQAALGILVNVWRTEFQIIGNVIGAAADVIRTVVGAIGVILDRIGAVIKVIVGIWQVEFAIIGNVIRAAAGAIGIAVSVIANVLGGIGTAIRTVAGVVGTVVGGIVGIFLSMPGRIAGALSNLFSPLWNGFREAVNNIIRGWNSLKFGIPGFDVGPVHFGGVTIGTPNIPYLHLGGIVPGVPGADVLAVLQAGEQVTPRSQVGAPSRGSGKQINLTINIGSFTGTDHDIDRLSDRIARRLTEATASTAVSG